MAADSHADGRADPEAALDRLIDLGAVSEDDEGNLSTTPEFENKRRVYRDTYDFMGDDGVADSVADLFGVSKDEALDLLERGEVTSEDVVAYLAIQSFADESLETAEHAMMAELLVRLGPDTPVPAAIDELDDEDYRAFLDANPDAVVTVWKHHCDPCETMKADIDEILDAVPEGVAVAGVDGESVPQFRGDYEVNAAPALCCFRDGALERVETGRKRPAEAAALFADVYDTSA